MKEIWKTIPGYEGLYEVSSLGRVRSIDRIVERNRFGKIEQVPRQGKILSPGKNKDGYLNVNLHRDGILKNVLVHRVVLQVFYPSINLHESNHEDFNRANNYVINLVSTTHQENVDHSVKTGRYNKKLSMTIANKIRKMHSEGIPRKEIAKHFNVSRQTVDRIINKTSYSI